MKKIKSLLIYSMLIFSIGCKKTDTYNFYIENSLTTYKGSFDLLQQYTEENLISCKGLYFCLPKDKLIVLKDKKLLLTESIINNKNEKIDINFNDFIVREIYKYDKEKQNWIKIHGLFTSQKESYLSSLLFYEDKRFFEDKYFNTLQYMSDNKDHIVIEANSTLQVETVISFSEKGVYRIEYKYDGKLINEKAIRYIKIIDKNEVKYFGSSSTINNKEDSFILRAPCFYIL